jgi:hypothetical protein
MVFFILHQVLDRQPIGGSPHIHEDYGNHILEVKKKELPMLYRLQMLSKVNAPNVMKSNPANPTGRRYQGVTNHLHGIRSIMRLCLPFLNSKTLSLSRLASESEVLNNC